MMNYPVNYEVSVKSGAGVARSWSGRGSQSEREVEVAIPPDFGGEGSGFSPEELYALSLANCFVATFKVEAGRLDFGYDEIALTTRLTEDRDESGKPWMALCKFTVRLAGTQDQTQARELLETVSRECFILNSVRTEKQFEFIFN